MASGFYGYTLCNVLFLTGIWRYSILDAGLSLTPGPIVAIAVAAPASLAVARFGHRAVAVPGALIWAAGVAFFATSSRVPRLPGRMAAGDGDPRRGAGLSFPTLSGAAVQSVPGPRFALATSLNAVARQVGAALGVAVLIAIVGNTAAPSIPHGLPAGLVAALEHSALQHALHSFDHGWLYACGCFLFGAIVCLGLRVSEPEDSSALQQDLAGAAGAPAPAAGPAVPELPSLAESGGVHAIVEPQPVTEFLLNAPVFAGLGPRMLARVADLAGDVTLARGEWLFREGEEADAVYIVRVGHLEVVRDVQDDAGGTSERTINTLTRGAVLGELALLSDATRSASVRALRDTELLRIDKPDFDALLHSEPELALSLTRVLSAQLQASQAIPAQKRARPVTLALRAAGPGVALLDIADELSRALCAWGRVAVLYPADAPGSEAPATRAEAAARYRPLVENCELEHDQVIMVCGEARSQHVGRVLHLPCRPRPRGGRRAPAAGAGPRARGVGGAVSAARTWSGTRSPRGRATWPAGSAGSPRRASSRCPAGPGCAPTCSGWPGACRGGRWVSSSAAAAGGRSRISVRWRC